MDVVLLIVIGVFVVGGWRTGFLRRLLGLGFLVLAFVLGAYLRHPVGVLASRFLRDVPGAYADMLGYGIVFVAVLVAAQVLTRMLLGRVAVDGLSRAVDQVLGAIFGALEAILLISAVIVILDTYFGTKSSLGSTVRLGFLQQLSTSLNASTIGHALRAASVPIVLRVLGPLLPKDIARLLPTGLSISLPSGLPLPRGVPILSGGPSPNP
jgi:uncharacterized membrane protein required for colicin V production